MESKHLAKENTLYATIHTSFVFLFIMGNAISDTKAVSCFQKRHVQRNTYGLMNKNAKWKYDRTLNKEQNQLQVMVKMSLTHKIRHAEIISGPSYYI